MRTSSFVSYVVCFYLLSLFSVIATADEKNDILAEAAAELERQNQAWDDLTVEYSCEDWIPDDKGEWKLHETLMLRWAVTQSGWERILRSRSESAWTEEAAFNGEYYMTYDSQQQGSAGVGHQISSFLNITYSPKIFGFFVTGLELGQPVSVAEFLQMEASHAKVLSEKENLVIVEGDDPLAVGIRLKLTLDAKYGYRPIEIEVRDQHGLLSTYKDIEYEQFTGKRGTFWFPRKGSWYGVNPEDRSPGTRMDYSLIKMEVDQNPEKQDFQLTYPKGTLLLNTDTGETTYAAAVVNLEDLIGDKGKTISMEQHDKIAAQNLPRGPAQEDESSNMKTLVLVNLAIIVLIILTVLFVRYRRHKSV
ncbi:hypothetical protein [Gimesia fumaroli]|jgi:hypothetical protein|uniref:Uncharacterized protein n=1 Tax=Gimesia fumaroli TaxID=2527976 RepID=A0A518ICI0_9PLAN|nr:hypothetical protein [Gimesia fumaroli]QDV50729.1 hypothetical protein Enr17x_27720 [Gimesia fumaroli]